MGIIKDMIKTEVFEKIDLKMFFDSKQGRPVKDLIFDFKTIGYIISGY